MISQDRYNRLDLEVRQLRASLLALQDQAAAAVQELEAQRDLARRVAVRLEQENHALAGAVCAICAGVIVPVPVIGEAR